MTTERAMSEHMSNAGGQQAEGPEHSGEPEHTGAGTAAWSEPSGERADQTMAGGHGESAGAGGEAAGASGEAADVGGEATRAGGEVVGAGGEAAGGHGEAAGGHGEAAGGHGEAAGEATGVDRDASRTSGADRSHRAALESDGLTGTAGQAAGTGATSAADGQAGAGGDTSVGTSTAQAQSDGSSAPWLVPAERAQSYRDRWNQLKGEFVDDPRQTVRQIDALIGEVLDEIEHTFQRQRRELESGMADDQASTEDLRVAFGRYREFFDRLLSV